MLYFIKVALETPDLYSGGSKGPPLPTMALNFLNFMRCPLLRGMLDPLLLWNVQIPIVDGTTEYARMQIWS